MTREERLFWIGLSGLVVLLLVVGTVVAVVRGERPEDLTYLPDESKPENVVYNAYVAARRQDIERFRGYFKGFPWRTPPGEPGEVARIDVFMLENGEVRVGEAEISGDKAIVSVLLIRQWSDAPFGTRISVQEERVTLVKEGGRWLIVTRLPFVYPIFEQTALPAPVPLVEEK